MSDFSAILERLRELEESGHGDAPINAMSRADLIDYLGTTDAEVANMSDDELRDAAEEKGMDMAEGASAEEEDEFHKDLDKLVHKTFGHSSDEKKKKTEGEACNHTPEGEECPEHGLAECGSMMVTMGEGTKADPEIVRKFAKVSDSKRSYYVMKWAEEQGMDSDEAMELAGYKKGDYRGYGSYNWHYVGESEDAIEECGPADMREQRLAQRVIELTQRLQSFKEQLAEMDPAPQDPEEIKKQQTITTNLNQMKAAGVDIDPAKGTEDPAFNKEVGDKVAAAMADPALGQQLKGVLGKVKD